MDEVFVVLYQEVFGEKVKKGTLIEVFGDDDCLIKLEDNSFVTVELWCVFDTMAKAQECLNELLSIEQDAREDAAQAYYDDFLLSA